MIHEPIYGTKEEGRGNKTHLADSGCCLEAIGNRHPDFHVNQGAWVKIVEKIEYNIRRAYPLKS